MPAVPKKIRRERAARLRAAGEVRLSGLLKTRIGKTASVLIEKDNMGRCEQFLQVRLNQDVETGTIVNCQISGTDKSQLDATIV
jgi:threonylcarbamoyladenosine tRNA methylthiotransferase MtaB